MPIDFNIILNTHPIHIHRYGYGKKLLIIFHGYGENGAVYASLEQSLGKYYTLIIPDLPFHGQTKWGENPLTTGLLVEFVRLILEKENANSCSILGYSMGGRPALCLMQGAPALVDQLILVAPEGLRKNRWFHFATGTLIGQWLFRSILLHPNLIPRLINLVKKTGLVSKGQASYVEKLMADPSDRRLVYHCWRCFSQLKPSNISHLFKKTGTPVLICFGAGDRLIPPPDAREIKQWKPAETAVFPTGHSLLRNEAVLQKIYTYLCRPVEHK